MLFEKRDFITLSATGVTLPKPSVGIGLPNGKRIVLIIVKWTARAFLCVFPKSYSLHEHRKRQPSLCFENIAHSWPPMFACFSFRASKPGRNVSERASRMRIA